MKGVRTVGRRNFIGRFSCTNHFLDMVWKRKVEIEEILPALEASPKSKFSRYCLLIPLEKPAREGPDALLVKVKKGCLITTFFIRLGEYQGKNLKDHFVLSLIKYKTN